MSFKDRSLVRKTLEGDREAFGDLVERYSGLVYGMLREKLYNCDEVEDLAQEVFCRAYEKLQTLQNPSRFGPWLGTLTVRIAMDWLRKQQIRERGDRQAITLALMPEVPNNPSEQLEANDGLKVIWEALDRLSPELRRTVVLHYIEGCACEDIARFTGVSTHTVRWRLRKARKKIEVELGKILFGQIKQQPVSKRQVRNQVLAVIPFLPFAMKPQGGWGERPWPRKGMIIAGSIGVLSWWGISGQDVSKWVPDTRPNAPRDLRVHYQPMELPKRSFTWQPGKPQQGEQVRLAVFGDGLSEQDAVELHYITNPVHPRDQVVPMQRDGNGWMAEVEVPKEAEAVFFFAAPSGERMEDFGVSGTPPYRGYMQRYAHSFLVHNKDGQPLQDAHFRRAHMANQSGSSIEDILTHCERELALHPDHIRVRAWCWGRLLWSGIDREGPISYEEALSRIEAEKRVETERLSHLPLVYSLAAAIPTPSSPDYYRQLYRRFPEDKMADFARYAETRLYLQRGRRSEQVDALQTLLEETPRSKYADWAYRDLLLAMAQVDEKSARVLADSLTRGLIDVSPVQLTEEDPTTTEWIANIGGSTALGVAYSLSFDLWAAHGERAEIETLVHSLIDADIQDVQPYIYIGEKLLGRDTVSLLVRSYPPIIDLNLAGVVLNAGLDKATPEEMLQTPGLKPLPELPEHAMERWDRFYLDRMYTWRVRALWGLGEYYVLKKARSQAEECLREAVVLQQKKQESEWKRDRLFAEIYLLLGALYEDMGQWQEAYDTYSEVLSLFYSHPQAEKALARTYRQIDGDEIALAEVLSSFAVTAAEIALPNVQGDPVRLSDYKGQPVILYWGAVKREFADVLVSVKASFAREGLEILYVTGDYARQDSLGLLQQNADALRALARKMGHPYEFLIDNTEIYRSPVYSPRGNTVFLIDPSGKLVLKQHWPDKNLPYLLMGKLPEYERQIREKIAQVMAADDRRVAQRGDG